MKKNIKKILLPILVPLLVLVLVLLGKSSLVVTLFCIGIGITVLIKKPMIGVFFLLLFSTENLHIISISELPYWQIMPGFRINMSDGLLIVLLILSLLSNRNRMTKFTFSRQVFLVGILVCITFILGIVFGYSSLDIGFQAARSVFAYTFYFILVILIDSNRKLKTIIIVIFVIASVAMLIQLFEQISGQRVNLGLGSSGYYGHFRYIDVQGEEVPYLWNRSMNYLILAYFLSIGCAFDGRKPKLYLSLSLIFLAGIGLTLVRQSMVYTGIGLITMLILALFAGKTRAVTRGVMTIGAMIITLILVTPKVTTLQVIADRMATVTNPQDVSTFQIRMEKYAEGFEYFSKSPILGYGFSRTSLELIDSDVGFINAIIQFGILGMFVFSYLILSVLGKAYSSYRNMLPSLNRGYMLGLIGVWVMFSVGFFTAMDSFSRGRGIWTIALILALIDRITHLTHNISVNSEL